MYNVNDFLELMYALKTQWRGLNGTASAVKAV